MKLEDIDNLVERMENVVYMEVRPYVASGDASVIADEITNVLREELMLILKK